MEIPERAELSPADQQLHDRLRRVEGQVRGIARMIEERRTCSDVVIQLAAARAALDRVTEQLISTHIEDCLTRLPPEEARAAVTRAIKLLARIER